MDEVAVELRKLRRLALVVIAVVVLAGVVVLAIGYSHRRRPFDMQRCAVARIRAGDTVDNAHAYCGAAFLNHG